MLQSEGLCWEVMEGHGRSSGSSGEGRGNRGRGVAGLAGKTGNEQCLFLIVREEQVLLVIKWKGQLEQKPIKLRKIGRSSALREIREIQRHGHYWPTVLADYIAHAKSCDACQSIVATAQPSPPSTLGRSRASPECDFYGGAYVEMLGDNKYNKVSAAAPSKSQPVLTTAARTVSAV
nr:hypothetical protein [Tanacetum cinerariifolium]